MKTFAVVYTVLAMVAISRTVDNVLEGIVLIAAALAAIGIIWAKGVIPLVYFGRRASKAIDLLFELHDWKPEVDKRLERIEEQLNPPEAVSTVRHEFIAPTHDYPPRP